MSKYHNRKAVTPDGVFDSGRELIRWQELKLREKAGEISNLRRQVSFELIPKIGKNRPTNYVADFVWTEGGKEVVGDAKGYRTEVYKLKRKMMRDKFGIEVVEM